MATAQETAHKTAITRSKPSLPARELVKKGLVRGRILDFGCGKGTDAEFLACDGYDPYFAPEYPEGEYDTILCTFVLNTLDSESRGRVLLQVASLLAPGGKAYITVRRDLKQEGFTSKGTYQETVELGLPAVAQKKNHFVTYVLEN